MNLKTPFITPILSLLFIACNDEDDSVIQEEPYVPITINSNWFDVNYLQAKTYSL